MAGEQSSGTFVPSRRDAGAEGAGGRAGRGARVVGEVATPSLPGAGAPKGGRPLSPQARVDSVLAARQSRPLAAQPDGDGRRQPVRAAAVLGPAPARPAPARRPSPTPIPGPRFGVEGTRRLAGVEGRPLIGTIIKPSVGFGPEETAALVRTLCEAGIDFIKDDELQADGPHCPFDERARAVMRVINDHADRTGKKVMFAFNITGDLDQMRRRHDLVLELGGTCVMASLNSVGLVGMIELGRFSAAADPRPPQRLGLSVPPPAARLVLRRLAEDLAAGRRRPHARQRPAATSSARTTTA